MLQLHTVLGFINTLTTRTGATDKRLQYIIIFLNGTKAATCFAQYFAGHLQSRQLKECQPSPSEIQRANSKITKQQHQIQRKHVFHVHFSFLTTHNVAISSFLSTTTSQQTKNKKQKKEVFSFEVSGEDTIENLEYWN